MQRSSVSLDSCTLSFSDEAVEPSRKKQYLGSAIGLVEIAACAHIGSFVSTAEDDTAESSYVVAFAARSGTAAVADATSAAKKLAFQIIISNYCAKFNLTN